MLVGWLVGVLAHNFDVDVSTPFLASTPKTAPTLCWLVGWLVGVLAHNFDVDASTPFLASTPKTAPTLCWLVGWCVGTQFRFRRVDNDASTMTRRRPSARQRPHAVLVVWLVGCLVGWRPISTSTRQRPHVDVDVQCQHDVMSGKILSVCVCVLLSL